MPKVSVIIPTYKARETIAKTLHSIAAQSIVDDIEIVIINDHDGLDYSDILGKFSDLDIKYIVHSENQGCGGARNTGIREAKNSYIVFADSDDQWANPLAIELLYCAITSQKADAVRSAFLSEIRDEKGITIRKMEHTCTWVHGCMFRRQYLLDNNLWFSYKLRLNEDMLFNQLLVDGGAKIVEIPEITYCWRDNPKSVTHESIYKNKAVFVEACEEYIAECERRGMSGERITTRVLQNLMVIYQYYNVVCDECEDRSDEFLALCKRYWKSCAPIVSDVDDEWVTQVYVSVMRGFEIIPTVGFMEFLEMIRN